MFVPGAMAAMLAESVMKTPADPARDPLGAIYTMTGTVEPKIPWTIFLVDSSKPPGVFISITSTEACSPSALEIEFKIYSAVAGLIVSSTWISTTFPFAKPDSRDNVGAKTRATHNNNFSFMLTS